MDVTIQFIRKATQVSKEIPLDFYIEKDMPIPRVGEKVRIKKRLYVVEEVLHDYKTIEDDEYTYTELVVNVLCKRVES